MLGQMVRRLLSRLDGLSVECTTRGQKLSPFYFDAEQGSGRLEEILTRYGPFDYLINCIGALSHTIDEHDSQSVRRAIQVNALFPHDLAAMAQATGSRVIHISTDGVFARNAGVCLEDSPTDSDDVYGDTKRLGEVIGPSFLTLRCSIIGPNLTKKRGLLEWFRSQPLGREVHGFTDHMWNGVTTFQFAKLCSLLISEQHFDRVRYEAPVHHFCPNKTVSKYELLQMFRTSFRPDITVKPMKSRGTPISRILDTRYHSLKGLFGYGIPMQNAIEELSAEMRAELTISKD